MSDLNRKICDYIANEWIGVNQSNTEFALNHNVDEKTVRRILTDKNYTITLYTLNKICEARNLKLREFFGLLDV
jgi:DNA-binding Xre family transcriptional regulator